MERRDKWLGAAVLAASLLISWWILRPVLHRPTYFTRYPVAPLHLENAELQAVTARLDQELSRRGFRTFGRLKWESERLKRRRLSLDTRRTLPLRRVLDHIEEAAGVRFDYGLCGTCGGTTSGIRVRDAGAQPNPRRPAPMPGAGARPNE